MKLSTWPNCRPPVRGAREPLRTLREFAEEFGVPVQALACMVGHDATAPKPHLRPTKHLAYYAPSLMRAWWRERTREVA